MGSVFYFKSGVLMSDLEIVSAFKKLVANGTVTPYRVKVSYLAEQWEVVNPLVSHSADCPYKVLGLVSKGHSCEFVAYPVNGNVGFCHSLDAAVRWIMSCYPVSVEM